MSHGRNDNIPRYEAIHGRPMGRPTAKTRCMELLATWHASCGIFIAGTTVVDSARSMIFHGAAHGILRVHTVHHGVSGIYEVLRVYIRHRLPWRISWRA